MSFQPTEQSPMEVKSELKGNLNIIIWRAPGTQTRFLVVLDVQVGLFMLSGFTLILF